MFFQRTQNSLRSAGSEPHDRGAVQASVWRPSFVSPAAVSSVSCDSALSISAADMMLGNTSLVVSGLIRPWFILNNSELTVRQRRPNGEKPRFILNDSPNGSLSIV